MSASVFPARAGMSPVGVMLTGACSGVPRASGDEPRQLPRLLLPAGCSPRERG